MAVADAPAVPRWWGRHVHELRWQAELARLVVDPVFLGRGVPRGDGRPVVLIPGFLAGDGSLQRHGRVARPHRLPRARLRDPLQRRLLGPRRSRLEARASAAPTARKKKVALIGHSRGGHFAKALAHRRPTSLLVVSMGAGLDNPFDISRARPGAPSRLVRAVHARTTDRRARRGCLTAACACEFRAGLQGAVPREIPLTSIYSRGDGVVRWTACIVPYARNVEVTGSHIGLAFNRKAYRAVAEALAACA